MLSMCAVLFGHRIGKSLEAAEPRHSSRMQLGRDRLKPRSYLCWADWDGWPRPLRDFWASVYGQKGASGLRRRRGEEAKSNAQGGQRPSDVATLGTVAISTTWANLAALEARGHIRKCGIHIMR